MSKQKAHKKPTGVSMAIPLWQHKHFLKWFVFLFSVFLFVNSIPNDYNLDDELVTNNHRLTSKGISAISEIFTSPYYQDASGYSYEYRPVVLTTFAIEHQFFGDNAHTSHFLNVLFYALCCVLLFACLQMLFVNYSSIIPFAITLLFAAHPAHTEVVCSIKNRDEILGLLFGLLSLFAALKVVQTRQWWFLILAPLSFALALMSKITVISFLPIIPFALILFTEVGFRNVVLVTLLLEVPAYFLLNVGLGSQKVFMLTGILAGVSLLYGIINFSSIQTLAKKYLNFISAKLLQSETPIVANKENAKPEYGFKDIFVGIIPDKQLFSLFPLFVSLVPAILYLFLVNRNYSLCAILPLIVLLLLAWKGERRISWWANAILPLTLALNLYNLSLNIEHIGPNGVLVTNAIGHFGPNSVGYQYATYLAPYLIFLVVFGERTLFIPSLLSLIILNFINVIQFRNWDALPVIFFVPVFLNRFGRYIILSMLIVCIIVLYPFNHVTDATDFLQFAIGIVMVCAAHFKRGSNILPWIIVTIIIVLFHINYASKDKSIQPELAAISEAANKNNPKIISKEQDRPLAYVEECVKMDDPISIRVGTSLEICFHYLQKVIVPYPLAFYYGFKFIKPMKITDTIPLISLLIHLFLFLIAFLSLYKNRAISLGLFTYLISILVFSNYLQPVPGMIADRFLLIPSLGWCIVCVIMITKIFNIKSDRKLLDWNTIPVRAKYTLLGILLFYSTITFARNFDWKNDLSLFEHDINYVDESSQAHNLLALHLMNHTIKENEPAAQAELKNKALLHFKAAVKIYPPFYNATFDIARTYTTLNMPDSAIIYFKKAIDIDSSNSDAHLYVAKLLLDNKRDEEAIPFYKYRIRSVSTDYTSYGTLSYIYFTLKNYSKSIAVNRSAIAYMPNLPDPFVNIGRTYLEMKQTDSARYYFKIALDKAPENVVAQQLLKQTELGKP